jgi:hypothetical protein
MTQTWEKQERHSEGSGRPSDAILLTGESPLMKRLDFALMLVVMVFIALLLVDSSPGIVRLIADFAPPPLIDH